LTSNTASDPPGASTDFRKAADLGDPKIRTMSPEFSLPTYPVDVQAFPTYRRANAGWRWMAAMTAWEATESIVGSIDGRKGIIA